MSRDHIFQDRRTQIGDFNFGSETANVFDDMLDRSVPYYGEIQRMIVELAAEFGAPGSALYDLGCSTGNSLVALDAALNPDVAFIGMDYSPEMLAKAESKLEKCRAHRKLELRQADLNHGLMIENASVVIMNLTLQFVRPLHRQKLMQSIVAGLRESGCLILVEKVLEGDSTLNRLFIKNYYAFKERQGYSHMEIAQKREALENVLIPYRLEENIELLRASGFSQAGVFFKWYNFCGIIALK
jgi:tRNA (cmo5U34)-methyltransferase